MLEDLKVNNISQLKGSSLISPPNVELFFPIPGVIDTWESKESGAVFLEGGVVNLEEYVNLFWRHEFLIIQVIDYPAKSPTESSCYIFYWWAA